MDDDQARELEALEHILGDANAEPTKLSYALLKFITCDFSNEIGHGGFGVVYLGNLLNGLVAVKRLFKTPDFDDELFLTEITCLMRAKHNNIVRFLGYCSDTQGGLMECNGKYVMAGDQNRLLCFEYVPNGNIQRYLKEKPHGVAWHKRYKMIKGICHGLHYLHQERISHLDLKPENVMLDANMEPKITDFGLSRIFGEGQTRIFTKNNIRGTLGYIAPEMIDNGEISFKSDIYSLGIIIIKLLTECDNIDFENWHESLDVECPQVKSCMEIARTCIEADKEKRPTVGEIIHKLKEMERMIQGTTNEDEGSSMYKADCPTAFPGNELLDVYPLELRFPFKQNGFMTCTLGLTNKTDCEVACLIKPDSPNRYRGELHYMLKPMSTVLIELEMVAQEELSTDAEEEDVGARVADLKDKLEVVMVVMSSDSDNNHDRFQEIVRSSGYDENHLLELGTEMHRATLTSVVVLSDSDQYADDQLRTEITIFSPAIHTFRGFVIGQIFGPTLFIEVHPVEPWILISEVWNLSIWNWQTKQKIYNYKGCAMSAKFIARKQCLVIGDENGSIFVHTCPSMDQVYVIRAHDDDEDVYNHRLSFITLAVHSVRPFLLSYCYDNGHRSMNLRDWNQDWLCVRSFNLRNNESCIAKVEFNPKDTNTFTTIDVDGTTKIWNIDYAKPIAKLDALEELCRPYVISFAYSGDRHLVTAISDTMIGVLEIWDLNTRKRAHAIIPTWAKWVRAVICHPTLPVLVTASCRRDGGYIHVWDSNTYRVKKTIKFRKPPLNIAFIASKRMDSSRDIDLECDGRVVVKIQAYVEVEL